MPSTKNQNGKRREKTGSDSEIFGIVLIIISAFILLCICIPIILYTLGYAVRNVTIGVFGLFSYPLFLCTLLWGIALLQGRKADISMRLKIGIAVMVIALLLILQLATTNSLLRGTFAEYMSGTYHSKTTAGGVVFGLIAYGIQKLISAPAAYVLFSLAFVAAMIFCVVLPLVHRHAQKATPSASFNPFVKGRASATPTRAINDNTLYVDTILPRADSFSQGQAGEDERESIPMIDETAQQQTSQQAVNNARVQTESARPQFETYNSPSSKPSLQGFKSEAHKILFGDRQQYTSSTTKPVDYAKEEREYMSGYTLPPLVTGPSIIDSTTSAKTTATSAPTPVASKPEKRVHSDKSMLPEVPMVPPKDISSQIVDGGAAIVNGDDLSRQLAEQMAPIETQTRSKENAPQTEAFAPKKLEISAVQAKNTQSVSAPEPAPIVNGDYFGTPNKPTRTVSAPVIPAPEISPDAYSTPTDIRMKADESKESTQAALVKEKAEEREEPLAPIVNASQYERGQSAEARFQELLHEERQRATEPRADDVDFSSENVPDEDPLSFDLDDIDPDAYDGMDTLLSEADEEEESLIVDDIPQQPRGQSAFHIIDEPIDLSEQSHFDGEDNTGYYSSVSVAQPSEKKAPEFSSVRSTDQIKIDDYVATTPVPAPKPKKKKRSRYTPPSTDMLILSDAVVTENYTAACEEKARVLEGTLQELKLPAKVTGITRGPAVTRFELEMPPGIPVKKIESCAADIAYYLESKGKIRIEAPIPGKRAVGIEVPNEEVDIVRLRDIIESKEFQNSSSPLTLALGKDVAGNNTICCLEKMPHLLIAGTTNSGKSVCLHSIIMSLMYKSSPEDVRMILIDPKCVEFNMYEGIPHLLGSELINDAQQAINVLSWAKDEMDRRYLLFAAHKARNLAEYNKAEVVKSGEEQKLPYIVIIVDELAELMLDVNSRKTLEGKITSIAQKARAAGIHLILATQRPSVDIITGTIKANLSSRIAFAVKSIVDSRTILDECGAETLLGRGDMLYAPIGMDDPHRVQGAFVTNEEIAEVTEFVRVNNEADFDEEFVSAIAKKEEEPELDGEEDDNAKEFDDLMPEVLKCVIDSGSASISMIQRRFSVGYARAARIVDQMEAHKFVSAAEGSKPRSVYITREQYKELFGTDV